MKFNSDLFNFFDLANSLEFKEFYDAFWELTHIPLALVDVKDPNNNILLCPKEKFNPICKLFCSSPKARKKCIAFDDIMAKEAAVTHRGICYKCHAGLMDFSVPIYVRKKHIATINCGQILPEAPTEDGFNKLWNAVCDWELTRKNCKKHILNPFTCLKRKSNQSCDCSLFLVIIFVKLASGSDY